MFAVALLIVSVVLLLATVMITLAGGIGWSLLTASRAGSLQFGAALGNVGPILVIALGILLFTGLMRWRKESLFNRKVADAMVQKAHALPGIRQTNMVASENEQQLRLHARQFDAANVMLALFAPVVLASLVWLVGQPETLLAEQWTWLVRLPCIGGYIVLLGALAIVVQALVNTTIDPLLTKTDG
jgi:hypothetical protein